MHEARTLKESKFGPKYRLVFKYPDGDDIKILYHALTDAEAVDIAHGFIGRMALKPASIRLFCNTRQVKLDT